MPSSYTTGASIVLDDRSRWCQRQDFTKSMHGLQFILQKGFMDYALGSIEFRVVKARTTCRNDGERKPTAVLDESGHVSGDALVWKAWKQKVVG